MPAEKHPTPWPPPETPPALSGERGGEVGADTTRILPTPFCGPFSAALLRYNKTMPRLLFLLVFLFSPVAARAAFSSYHCTLQMAFLSPSDTIPAELIRETYALLWKSVDTSRLSGDDARATLEAKDPFELPTAKDSELYTLRKRLTELRDMLNKRGWNTPELRKILLDDIKTLAVQHDQLDAHLQRIRLREGKLKTTYDMGANRSMISPDGRYLMGVPLTFEGDFPLFFMDRTTKKRVDLTVPDKGDYLRQATFTPDGKHVLLLNAQGPAVNLYPFADGKIDVTKETVISAVTVKDRLRSLISKSESVPGELASFSGDGSQVVVSYPFGGLRFYLYDLAKRTGQKLDVSSFGWEEKPTIQQWGYIPGTNRMYFLVTHKGGNFENRKITLDFGDVTAKGLVKTGSMPQDRGETGHDMGYRKLRWAADGKHAITTTRFGESKGPGLDIIDTENGTSTPIARGQYDGKMTAGMVAHPVQKHLIGVIFRRDLMDKTHTLAWYDTHAKKWDGEQDVQLNLNDDIGMSPDGLEIFTNLNDNVILSTPIVRD